MIALIDGKQVNTFNNLSLICPYCGHSEFVFSHDSFDRDEIERKFVCPKCKKSFIGTRMAVIAYETYKCDEDEKEMGEDESEYPILDTDEVGDINSNHHEFVDLGLPSGTLWAKCNVGAEKETDYGGYYQWGGTEDIALAKKICDWSTYPYGTNFDALTKYNTNDECGVVDNKTELELSDDVAHQIMGGDWHMPSVLHINELLSNTISEWTTVDGVNGRRFTSKFNGQSIFIPVAGWRGGHTLGYVGYDCGLWSGSLYQTNPNNAYYLNFYSDGCYIGCDRRCYGQPVRGVIG